MNNKGISSLAATLHGRMVQTSEKPSIFDLGTIQADGSLLPDQYPIPIPKAEYLVCRSLVHDDPITTTVNDEGKHGHGPSGEHSQTEGTGQHTHPATEGAHIHHVKRPESMAPLKSGDRVLIAWIGVDVVIIDVVYQGNI